jgi:hypothetical protein
MIIKNKIKWDIKKKEMNGIRTKCWCQRNKKLFLFKEKINKSLASLTDERKDPS